MVSVIRKSFADAIAMLSDRTFKRKYRVSKRTFSEILEKIKPSIEGRPRDHRCFNGSAGKVDTDIKLACALRQLSGGSYLDVHSECGVSISTYYKAVWEVFEAIDDAYDISFPLPRPSDSQGEKTAKVQELGRLARGFQRKSTNGVIGGCVGAIDGLLVKIPKPPLPVQNPARFMSRKKFFALNVQAICDSNTKFLWLDVHAPGSTGDRLAFYTTQLSHDLKEHGLPKGHFIVGDAAYELSEYMLTPYPGRLGHGLTEDEDSVRLLSLHCFSRSLFSLAHARKSRVQFNYYQSQLRIQVERSFGFLVRRFGIFWRSNSAPLDRVALTVAVAAKVHNVAVDASDWASDEAYGEGDGSSAGGAGYLTTRTVGTSSSAAPKSGEEARDKVKNGISDAGLKRSAASRARMEGSREP